MSPPNFRSFVSAALMLVLASLARAEVKVGDAFPSLAPTGVSNLGSGDIPALSGKVVLVDFWASWCAPCKESFPVMAKLQKEYAARGFLVVAVGVDEKPAPAQAFWKKMAAPFIGLHDREMKLVKQVAVPTMPTSYLLGRDGRVRFMHQGFHGDTSEKALRKDIEALLAEKN